MKITNHILTAIIVIGVLNLIILAGVHNTLKLYEIDKTEYCE